MTPAAIFNFAKSFPLTFQPPPTHSSSLSLHSLSRQRPRSSSAMTDGPLAPDQPDPPGQNPLKTPSVKGKYGPDRTSLNDPSNPFNPSPSQSTGRPASTGLAAFESGKRRKRQATSGPDDQPRKADHSYLSTPRSVRFQKLFTDTSKSPGILDVGRNIHDIIAGAINFLKKGPRRSPLDQNRRQTSKHSQRTLWTSPKLWPTFPAWPSVGTSSRRVRMLIRSNKTWHEPTILDAKSRTPSPPSSTS